MNNSQVGPSKCQQASYRVCLLLLATDKCWLANVNRQVFVSKLLQRVPTCPSMSHRVPNISFCWRQASVDWQMSTGNCCTVCRQTVPTCLNKSQQVSKSHRVPNNSFFWQQANVDCQMSTGKLHCSSAICPNMSQHVPTSPKES